MSTAREAVVDFIAFCREVDRLSDHFHAYYAEDDDPALEPGPSDPERFHNNCADCNRIRELVTFVRSDPSVIAIALARSEAATGAASTFECPGPCPSCGQAKLFGYSFTDEYDRHMHAHYVCTHWSNTKGRCGWHDWSVPAVGSTGEPT